MISWNYLLCMCSHFSMKDCYCNNIIVTLKILFMTVYELHVAKKIFFSGPYHLRAKRVPE